MFGQAFLIALTILPFMYLISWGFERVLMRSKYGKLINTILNILFFFGVIVHESCHYVMCVITGVPVNKFSVRYRHRQLGIVLPRGSVTPSKEFQITFMQGCAVSFAPLIIGIWIFYYLLLVVFHPFVDPFIRIITGIFSVSVLLCSQPSMGDLEMVAFSFKNDSRHSIYQAFLLLLSLITAWITVGVFNILLPFEFLYYFIIIFYYFLFKYYFILIHIGIRKIQNHRGKSRYKTRYKRYVRKRQRPDIVNKYLRE